MPDNFEPYVENPDHVPASTDLVDQFDTTGLGGTSNIKDLAPVFNETANRELVEASDTLQNYSGRHSSGVQTVILPGDDGRTLIHPDERKDAEAALHEKAASLREEGVLSPVDAQAEGFRRGAAPAGGDRVRLTAGGSNPASSGSTGRPSDAGTQKTGPTAGSRKGAGTKSDDEKK